jgi:hypothetical protein
MASSSSSRLPPPPSNSTAYYSGTSSDPAAAATGVAYGNHYRMERVLYNLHYQLCSAALRRTSRRTRTAVEHGVLVLSVCCFGVLLIVHWSFVYRGASGMSSISSSSCLHNHTTTATNFCRSSNSPLAALHPSARSSCEKQFVEESSSSISSSGGGGGGPLRCLSSVPGYRSDADVTHLSLLRARNIIPTKDDHRSSSSDGKPPTRRPGSSYAYIESWKGSGAGECHVEKSNDNDPTLPFLSRPSSCSHEADDEIVSHIYYSYSRVKGYLLLPPELCRDRGLTVQHVVISPKDSHCFGEPFLRRLVFGVTGVDTVMVNWFLAGQDRATGYLLNPRIDEPGNLMDLEQLYHAEAGIVMRQHTRSSRWKRRISQLPSIFASSSSKTIEPDGGASTTTPDSVSPSSPSLFRQLLSKLTVVVKTSFLFFIITTLVSFTLRETQERMIDFTHQLREVYARGGDLAVSGQTGGGHGHAATDEDRRQHAIMSWLPFPRVANWHVVPLVVRHLAENLLFVPIMIGMIFFLIEFYRGDKFLAFMVVSLVWLCEVFTVIRYASVS